MPGHLNLQNIAKGIIDLSHGKESNLAYLKEILHTELAYHHRRYDVHRRKRSGFGEVLPQYNALKLNKKHHIYNEQRIVLMGRCGGGQASDANVN